MTATVTVTGGAGFLGMHLARRLTGEGMAVRLFDAAPRPAWVDQLGAGYTRGDVRDLDAVVRLAEGSVAVVHAAFAPPQADPKTIRSVNVEGTKVACRAARATGARLVVLSSTIVSRRLHSHPLSQRAPVSRLTEYRDARAAAEEVATGYAAAGLSVAVVRPKTFVGPGRLGGFALVFDAIRRGRRVLLTGNGRNRYQLVDIEDLAAGLSLLARAGGATGLFCFGAAEVGDVAHDLGALVDHAGTGARLQFVPGRAARIGLRSVELAGLPPLAEWHHCGARGDDSVVDISRARHELGWEPLCTNAEALIGAYDWYVGAQQSGPVASTHPVPASHRLLQRLTGARAGG